MKRHYPILSEWRTKSGRVWIVTSPAGADEANRPHEYVEMMTAEGARIQLGLDDADDLFEPCRANGEDL